MTLKGETGNNREKGANREADAVIFHGTVESGVGCTSLIL